MCKYQWAVKPVSREGCDGADRWSQTKTSCSASHLQQQMLEENVGEDKYPVNPSLHHHPLCCRQEMLHP